VTDLNPDQFLYHGTVRNRLRTIKPATQHGRGVIFPHETDRGFAYATPDVRTAWSYAEKAWNAGPPGTLPRVYKVAPLNPGDVEKDPQYRADGTSRGNYSNDLRSPTGFRVLSQEQWPEDFGDKADWR